MSREFFSPTALCNGAILVAHFFTRSKKRRETVLQEEPLEVQNKVRVFLVHLYMGTEGTQRKQHNQGVPLAYCLVPKKGVFNTSVSGASEEELTEQPEYNFSYSSSFLSNGTNFIGLKISTFAYFSGLKFNLKKVLLHVKKIKKYSTALGGPKDMKPLRIV